MGSITLESEKKYTLLSINGKLDALTVSVIHDDFINQTAGRNQSAIVDLSKVEFMASLGIRMVVEAAKKLRAADHRLILLKPTALVESSLVTCGLHVVVDIVHEKEKALEMASRI